MRCSGRTFTLLLALWCGTAVTYHAMEAGRATAAVVMPESLPGDELTLQYDGAKDRPEESSMDAENAPVFVDESAVMSAVEESITSSSESINDDYNSEEYRFSGMENRRDDYVEEAAPEAIPTESTPAPFESDTLAGDNGATPEPTLAPAIEPTPAPAVEESMQATVEGVQESSPAAQASEDVPSDTSTHEDYSRYYRYEYGYMRGYYGANADASQQTAETPKSEAGEATEASKMDDSNQSAETATSSDSTTTDESPKTDVPATSDESPMSDASSTTEESPKTDVPATSDESPMSDASTTTEESPKTDVPATSIESPMSDASSTIDESPKTDVPATSDESPKADIPAPEAAQPSVESDSAPTTPANDQSSSSTEATESTTPAADASSGEEYGRYYRYKYGHVDGYYGMNADESAKSEEPAKTESETTAQSNPSETAPATSEGNAVESTTDAASTKASDSETPREETPAAQPSTSDSEGNSTNTTDQPEGNSPVSTDRTDAGEGQNNSSVGEDYSRYYKYGYYEGQYGANANDAQTTESQEPSVSEESKPTSETNQENMTEQPKGESLPSTTESGAGEGHSSSPEANDSSYQYRPMEGHSEAQPTIDAETTEAAPAEQDTVEPQSSTVEPQSSIVEPQASPASDDSAAARTSVLSALASWAERTISECSVMFRNLSTEIHGIEWQMPSMGSLSEVMPSN